MANELYIEHVVETQALQEVVCELVVLEAQVLVAQFLLPFFWNSACLDWRRAV